MSALFTIASKAPGIVFNKCLGNKRKEGRKEGRKGGREGGRERGRKGEIKQEIQEIWIEKEEEGIRER